MVSCSHPPTRLQATLQLEFALFDLLQELAPEAESGEWQDLNVLLLTSTLKQLLVTRALIPLHVLRLLRSLAQDHDSDSQQRSSFELRQITQDFKLRIRGRYNWSYSRAGRKSTCFGRRDPHVLIGNTAGLTQQRPAGHYVHELMSLIDLTEPRTRIPESQRRKAVEHVLAVPA